MDGFFTQRDDAQLWPGERFSLAVRRVLCEETSPFQTLVIFESKAHGRVLALDGIIQCTERDEAQYHEMLVLPALCSHAAPKHVLIVGGGDGGAARECLRAGAPSVTLVDIDEAVVRCCRAHLRATAAALDDARVAVHIADGAVFVAESTGTFDVIIVDSSDPCSGPNCGLFSENFYDACKRALAPGGILVFQAEYHLLHLGLVADLLRKCRPLFAHVDYYCAAVPTYPGGGIGFLACSQSADVKRPVRDAPAGCKCYSKEMHVAAFVLPAQSRNALDAIE